jgi:hypothetical protein
MAKQKEAHRHRECKGDLQDRHGNHAAESPERAVVEGPERTGGHGDVPQNQEPAIDLAFAKCRGQSGSGHDQKPDHHQEGHEVDPDHEEPELGQPGQAVFGVVFRAESDQNVGQTCFGDRSQERPHRDHRRPDPH